MFFNKSQKNIEKLKLSFGKPKDDLFDFDKIDKYFRKKDNSSSFQSISDQTCNDLDIEELFTLIDRTCSKVGQQFLYNKLRTIPANRNGIDENEAIINRFITDIEFRVSVQLLLKKLDDKSSNYITSLFQDEHIKSPSWFWIVRLLSITSICSLLILPIYPQVFFVLLGLFIINTGFHYWNKRNLFQYIVSIPQLLILNYVAGQLFKETAFKILNPNLTESLRLTDKIKNRMAFMRLESSMQGELASILWSVIELIKILFLVEPILLFGVLEKLDSRRKEIEDLFIFVGSIDTFLSIAALREGLDQFCIPVISNSKKEILAREMYHPLIHNCVNNNIQVKQKSILLTGSNMSGKTSFIRTIGINAITGLTLNTCFAASFSLPLMKIHSAIRISDDLVNDRSYYFQEVLTIKNMIANCSNNYANLFLLDEIFKGTNTIERISAGKAVLSFLANGRNIVFVSTHDVELADLLKKEYELHHFSEKVDNKTVDFDYKLKDGKLKNRNAIKILEINEYPDLIIKEALEISKTLDNSNVGNNNG